MHTPRFDFEDPDYDYGEDHGKVLRTDEEYREQLAKHAKGHHDQDFSKEELNFVRACKKSALQYGELVPLLLDDLDQRIYLATVLAGLLLCKSPKAPGGGDFVLYSLLCAGMQEQVAESIVMTAGTHVAIPAQSENPTEEEKQELYALADEAHYAYEATQNACNKLVEQNAWEWTEDRRTNILWSPRKWAEALAQVCEAFGIPLSEQTLGAIADLPEE